MANLELLRNAGQFWDDAFGIMSELDRAVTKINIPHANQAFVAATDIKENADGYLLQLDVPGVALDQINIELENDFIKVSGERVSRFKSDNNNRLERNFGKFTRKFRLPKAVDREAIEAKLDQGVLEVFIPKAEELKPKKIKVSGGTLSTKLKKTATIKPKLANA